MTGYIIRRLVALVPVLFFVSVVTFAEPIWPNVTAAIVAQASLQVAAAARRSRRRRWGVLAQLFQAAVVVIDSGGSGDATGSDDRHVVLLR